MKTGKDKIKEKLNVAKKLYKGRDKIKEDVLKEVYISSDAGWCDFCSIGIDSRDNYCCDCEYKVNQIIDLTYEKTRQAIANEILNEIGEWDLGDNRRVFLKLKSTIQFKELKKKFSKENEKWNHLNKRY